MPAWCVKLKDKTVDHEETFLFPTEGPVFQFKHNPTSSLAIKPDPVFFEKKQTNDGSDKNELTSWKGKYSLQSCLCESGFNC